MTASYDELLNAHYGPTDISARILDCLTKAGKNLDALTREDITPFDEFHGGGRDSTRALARLAELPPGQRVLDLGCGIGGPARTLAAEFACEVTGVDLTAEFVRAAGLLSLRVGMQDQVRFLQGSALEIPVPDASFDVVWSQNVMMNIEDKPHLFAEVRRVLRPGGRFAFEAVLAGPGGDTLFPSFWAATADLSFLVTPATLKRQLVAAGLTEILWQDDTEQVIAVGNRRLAALERDGPPPLGIGVIVPFDVMEKTRNALRNNEEARTLAIQAIYRCP